MKRETEVKVRLGTRSYTITIAPGLLTRLQNYLPAELHNSSCLIVTDSNVQPLYGAIAAEQLQSAGAKVATSLFQAGEASKTLTTMATIYHDAVKAGLTRNSWIAALGGGVSGDMGGFAAATYMRGIRFIQLPTSLLAMVDSSVGGKTGVDLPEGKNLVGAFWQPQAVYIDPQLLQTLDKREIRCGLAEVVKYAVIFDKQLFSILTENIDKLQQLDLDFYSDIIARCCRIKADIVAADEREGGIRALLNYGHTFGHAIEQVANFTIGHGEGVAIGMCMAANLAVTLKLFEEDERQQQQQLLQALGLPTTTEFAAEEILEAMRSDKKNRNNRIVVVLPRMIGQAEVVREVDETLIIAAIKESSSHE